MAKIADEAGTLYLQQQPRDALLAKGQFFTPAYLCDFMITLALHNRADDRHILEPACGTGAFLLRLTEYQHETGRQFCLTAVERDLRAARLSREQLERHACPDFRILECDFLDTALDIAPQTQDVILGNPPYVRHELWAKDNAEAMNAIEEAYVAYLDQFPQQKKLFGRKSDLYLWFYLKATLLLKSGGRLVFVTSNSWLDTAYGEAFRDFLAHWYQCDALIESVEENWFAGAAINPLITVLTKREVPVPRMSASHHWPVTRLRESLSDLSQKKIHGLAHEILAKKKTSHSFFPRCPEPLAPFLTQVSSLLKPLSDFATVTYPIKTGINAFFYPDAQTIGRFGIEPQYLRPALKSAKQVSRYRLEAAKLETRLFVCQESKDVLKAKGHDGALAYITWGETQVAQVRQKRHESVLWPQVASVQGRPFWYACPISADFDLLASRFFDRRFFFLQTEKNLMIDQTFYGFCFLQEDIPIWMALLNSTFSYLLLELSGRTALGEGVLQFSKADMARLPVLSPALFVEKEQRTLQEAYTAMSQVSIQVVEEAVSDPARQALDTIVFNRLCQGTSWEPAAAQTLVNKALLDLVGERLRRGRNKTRSQG